MKLGYFRNFCLINNVNEKGTENYKQLNVACSLQFVFIPRKSSSTNTFLCVCQSKSDKRDYNASFKVIANVLIPSMWLITEKRVIKRRKGWSCITRIVQQDHMCHIVSALPWCKTILYSHFRLFLKDHLRFISKEENNMKVQVRAI